MMKIILCLLMMLTVCMSPTALLRLRNPSGEIVDEQTVEVVEPLDKSLNVEVDAIMNRNKYSLTDSPELVEGFIQKMFSSCPDIFPKPAKCSVKTVRRNKIMFCEAGQDIHPSHLLYAKQTIEIYNGRVQFVDLNLSKSTDPANKVMDVLFYKHDDGALELLGCRYGPEMLDLSALRIIVDPNHKIIKDIADLIDTSEPKCKNLHIILQKLLSPKPPKQFSPEVVKKFREYAHVLKWMNSCYREQNLRGVWAPLLKMLKGDSVSPEAEPVLMLTQEDKRDENLPDSLPKDPVTKILHNFRFLLDKLNGSQQTGQIIEMLCGKYPLDATETTPSAASLYAEIQQDEETSKIVLTLNGDPILHNIFISWFGTNKISGKTHDVLEVAIQVLEARYDIEKQNLDIEFKNLKALESAA